MKQLLLVIGIIFSLSAIGCTPQVEPIACTADAKICPDGSAVGRDPENNCDWKPCPDIGQNDDLGIATPYMQYISEDVSQCAATDWICPSGSSQFFDGSGCGCKADEPKIYISTDPDTCTLIKFMCEKNYAPFFDEKGCGCEYSFPEDSVPMPPAPGKLQAFDCKEPRPELCTMEYMPVCGWFSQDIQCIKYPCADTYGNKCAACADDKVAYYTEGECPSGDEEILR